MSPSVPLLLVHRAHVVVVAAAVAAVAAAFPRDAGVGLERSRPAVD